MIPIARPELPPFEDYAELLREIWSSRMLSNFGCRAQQLEALATRYLAVNARVVVNADIGLTLAIAALQVPRGAACLVPSFTFSSTVNAIVWNGLRPVFVDIDAATLNTDITAASEAASEDTRLIVATHVFGNPADTDGLAALASRLGARLLFDAAHAYGALRRGVHVGGFGDAEVFSLSGTKVVTSAEGGIVASRNQEFMERFLLARGYGFLGDYNTKVIGLNGKMSELHAALGLLSLSRIEAALEARACRIRRYKKRLAQVEGITYQSVSGEDRSTYKDFAVLFSNGSVRNACEAALTTEQVQTKRYFLPCHLMDAFRQYASRPLPVTIETYNRILCLPLYESLTYDEVDRICDVIIRTIS